MISVLFAAASALVFDNLAVPAAIPVTPETFAATLAGAPGGAVVQLGAGDYGDIYIRATKVYNPAITIDARAATFKSLRFDNVSGLRFKNIRFAGPANGGMRLNNFKDVQIDGLFADGSLRTGLSMHNGTDASVKRVEMIGMGSDGIAMSGVQRVTIKDMACHGGRPTPGAHPDCIQMYSKVGMLPLTDITISNVVVVGNTQGVSRYGDALPATRIKVDRVYAMTTMIAVATDHPAFQLCSDCAITNSTPLSLAGGKYIVQIAPRATSERWSGVLENNAPNSARPPQ